MLKFDEDSVVKITRNLNKKDDFWLSNECDRLSIESNFITPDIEIINTKIILNVNSDIESIIQDILKLEYGKMSKESINSIKSSLYKTRDDLKKNKQINEKYEHLSKLAKVILELKNLLNENMYVEKTKDYYHILMHNDDVIKYRIIESMRPSGKIYNISMEIIINEVKICYFRLQVGCDIDISFITPSFTFNDLISLINNSLDILKIRQKKIEIKKEEFANEIKNFYNENKMDDLINRIKNE